MTALPVLTQHLKTHDHGGAAWSHLSYEIYADGRPTGIKRERRTNGSKSGYSIAFDIFKAGDEEFDVMATKGVGMLDWIKAHLPEPPAEGASHE